jgi:hypothetical protein
VIAVAVVDGLADRPRASLFIRVDELVTVAAGEANDVMWKESCAPLNIRVQAMCIFELPLDRCIGLRPRNWGGRISRALSFHGSVTAVLSALCSQATTLPTPRSCHGPRLCHG